MALKSLKPFDCEEANELVVRAVHKVFILFYKNGIFHRFFLCLLFVDFITV